MEQPAYWLAEGVHTAFVGPDLVVLSLKSNAYYCLAEAARSVGHLEPGRISVWDEALVAQLETLALISKTAVANRAQDAAQAPRPACDLLDRPALVTGQDISNMVRAFGAMAQGYYGRCLWRMVRRAQARASVVGADEQVATAALMAKAAAFRWMLPWVPLQGECLFRAFMLLNFLHLAGHDARWIFGVRTWPFQAHCWLQAGDLVLDDAAERVSAFTPILVV
jgi:hypothetical protein